MKTFKKQLNLKPQEYYEVHLSIVNSVLPLKLTPKEVEVLACFMSLNEDIIKDRFGAIGKAMVKENLELSSAGLSNYIKSLKEKGFIIEVNKLLTIHPKIEPDFLNQEYLFKINKVNEE